VAQLHDEWLELHNRAIAEHDRALDRMREEHDRDIRAIRQMLRHAVRLAVQEARAERRSRKELDDTITQLSAAQLVTGEKLQSFIDSLRRGTNGSQQS
jgi:hypothetical protein